LSLFLHHLTCEASTSSATETKVQLISTETHQTQVLVDVVFGQRVEISAERNKPKDEDSSDTHVDVRRNTHKMLLKNAFK